MSKPTTIEPCPFCGGYQFDARGHAAEYLSVEPRDVDGTLTVNMDGFGWYWVFCHNCHAQGPKYFGGTNYDRGITGPKNFRRDKDKTAKAIATAIKAWNLRQRPQASLFDETEDLK